MTLVMPARKSFVIDLTPPRNCDREATGDRVDKETTTEVHGAYTGWTTQAVARQHTST